MLLKIWDLISNRHLTQQNPNQPRLIQLKIINRLTLGISISIFVHVLRDYFIFDFSWNWLYSARIILSAFLLYCFFHFKARFKSLFQFIIYVIIGALIFVMSLHYGLQSCFYLYFFPYLGSFSLIFNDRDNIKYTILLYSITFLMILGLHRFQFEPWYFGITIQDQIQQNIRLNSILEVLILTGFNSFYVFEKNVKLMSLNNNYQNSNEELIALKAVVEDTQINNMEELLDLAKSGDPGFLSLFQYIFPGLRDALSEINPSFGQEEFKLCAYIKLGFNTKEIAHFNHLSIRTVQTKKSRLRKTFNIPSQKNLYVWVSEISENIPFPVHSTVED